MAALTIAPTASRPCAGTGLPRRESSTAWQSTLLSHGARQGTR